MDRGMEEIRIYNKKMDGRLTSSVGCMARVALATMLCGLAAYVLRPAEHKPAEKPAAVELEARTSKIIFDEDGDKYVRMESGNTAYNRFRDPYGYVLQKIVGVPCIERYAPQGMSRTCIFRDKVALETFNTAGKMVHSQIGKITDPDLKHEVEGFNRDDRIFAKACFPKQH